MSRIGLFLKFLKVGIIYTEAELQFREHERESRDMSEKAARSFKMHKTLNSACTILECNKLKATTLTSNKLENIKYNKLEQKKKQIAYR